MPSSLTRSTAVVLAVIAAAPLSAQTLPQPQQPVQQQQPAQPQAQQQQQQPTPQPQQTQPQQQQPQQQQPQQQQPQQQQPQQQQAQQPPPAQGGLQPIQPAPQQQAQPGQLQPIIPAPIVQGDQTGEGGARAILQWVKNTLASPGGKQTTTPTGWQRTLAQGAPMTAAIHPKDWTATLFAQPSSYGAGVASAQGRMMSRDGLHLIEGMTNNLAVRMPPDQVLAGPMTAYLSQLGEERELHREAFSTPYMAGMMTAESYFRAVEGRDYTIVGLATTIVDPGMDQSAAMVGIAPFGPVSYKIIIGPKTEFTEMAQKLYIPILNGTTF